VMIPAEWNGRVIVWVDPDPQDVERIPPKAGEAKTAVLSIGVFMSGTFVPSKPLPMPSSRSTRPNPPYAGYVLGYNRSVLANRAHDVMTAVAFAKSWEKTRRVSLAALGEAGPAGLLAAAMDDRIAVAAIDLNHFDFDQITDENDPMILPGALKYGGVVELLRLCANGRVLVGNPAKPQHNDRLSRSGAAIVEERLRSPDEVAAYLLQ